MTDVTLNARLPNEFQVLLRKSELVLLDGAARATAQGMWVNVKAQLVSLGYTVWEWWDEDWRCYVAHCKR